MHKSIPPPTRELNRLRAAAALVPIIEAGLAESRLSVERACLMASFCKSAVEVAPDNAEELKLALTVLDGLRRLKNALPSEA